MIERLIENWLDKASERSYQVPFCHMLANSGHTVLHLSRHCGLEMGKDILAIAPDGTPCAYQLKSARDGKITLNQWRKEVSGQAFDLVVGDIIHPSIDSSKHHRAYLVTNGELEEEVSRAIDDMNRSWVKARQPHFQLRTVVRGQILKMAKDLETNLWPTELRDVNSLLQLFLEDGRGVLPKERLASIFEATMALSSQQNARRPSDAKSSRVLASGALLCAIAISAFSRQDNWVAEIEAWVLYMSYLLALVERWQVPFEAWRNDLEIVTESIYNGLSNLCDELRERKHFVEGYALTDVFLLRVRLTWLVALMSIYALWRRLRGEVEDNVDDFIRGFCLQNSSKLYLWGEAAIPQFLSYHWYLRTVDPTPAPDALLRDLIHGICKRNHPRGSKPLASPYYEAAGVLPYLIGISDETLDDSFQGSSCALEGLVHLFVRRNWKQEMKFLWPDVTRLKFEVFEPREKWHFYRWRNKRGTHKTVLQKPTQQWSDLKTLALESDGGCIPESIKKHPILVLLFLCVYPHRLNAETVRWLDTRLKGI